MKSKALALLSSVFLLPALSLACDPCSLYNASRLRGHDAGSFSLSSSEQFTNFDRAQGLEENSLRDAELVRGYSTTQIAAAYDITERLGMQLTLPFIVRKFDKIQQFRADTDYDSGIGDISLTGSYSFINYKNTDWVFIADFTAGIKFPTGDTGVLGDISEEQAQERTENSIITQTHHQIGSASGGRALTFGSGSFDYILGLNLISRYKRMLFLTSTQYTIRTEGDFNYEFADDVILTAAPGYYLMLEHDFTLGAALSFSGEFKNKDDLNSEKVAGSAISNLYLGPAVFFTLDENISAEITFDFRVSGEDAGSTVVPENRMRASMSYRFS